jgi:hypothetical protein
LKIAETIRVIEEIFFVLLRKIRKKKIKKIDEYNESETMDSSSM